MQQRLSRHADGVLHVVAGLPRAHCELPVAISGSKAVGLLVFVSNLEDA